MNQLSNALTPPPQAPTPPPAPPPKPKVDFQPMVTDAAKGKENSRGGLSSAIVMLIQTMYAQEIAQAGKSQPGYPTSGLSSGWGGSGR